MLLPFGRLPITHFYIFSILLQRLDIFFFYIILFLLYYITFFLYIIFFFCISLSHIYIYIYIFFQFYSVAWWNCVIQLNRYKARNKNNKLVEKSFHIRRIHDNFCYKPWRHWVHLVSILTTTSSSSSSYRAGSTDIPDPLSPSSLSFIALGRSSGQHPVSSHSCWMYVRAGRPVLRGHVWGSIRVHLLWVHLCFSSSVLHVWFV